jgi:hypothetical protein
LKHSGSRPGVNDVLNFLIIEMIKAGPYRTNWPNYGLLENKKHFHCHLKQGRPTYVACWKIVDEQNKKIEVYYVGSHENTPY